MIATAQNCHAINATKDVIRDVLETLAEPREDDEPSAHEERQRLFDRVTPLIEPEECPPIPPYGRDKSEE